MSKSNNGNASPAVSSFTRKEEEAVSKPQNVLFHNPFLTTSRRSSRYSGNRLPLADEAALSGSLNGSLNNSSAISAHSVDIDNPDPAVLRVVGRHLVRGGEDPHSFTDSADGFNSLKLQGGDITREIYNWQRQHEGFEAQLKRGRSRSFTMIRDPATGPSGEPLDTRQMLTPGGFRRNFLTHYSNTENEVMGAEEHGQSQLVYQPTVFTRNFIEFLSLYGHFAGEELEENEDENLDEPGFDREHTETSALLGQHRRQSKSFAQQAKGQASMTETVLLLLKSFVGTGVLFLPKAFYNGGILFSSVVLMFVSVESYWCFLLLIEAKDFTKVSSFGDIGGVLYGNFIRQLILASIVLSQIGFAAAYIVFVAENLQAFIYNVANGKFIQTSVIIGLQLLVFLPLSMIRDIAKLGVTALIADAFILAGLVYLYLWGGYTVLHDGISDVTLFNKQDWTLFIGTAIFTYEGIGLIIPIQESMRKPKAFQPVLGGVMIGITVLFISLGALLYAACGSEVQTIILLNLPKDSHAVDVIQCLYSLAILLSAPLQLFPAVRILENWIFVKSGKYNSKVKWQKNLFRFYLVFLTGIVANFGADDLDKFVALTGSFACIPLVYVYPPLLHLKVVGPHTRKGLVDLIIIIFGLGIMVYTTWSTLHSWVS